ncbi:molybdopterin-guanine dinucleotide biosynthesis protein MobB [Pedobacter sp. PACM 27299]|uniref:DUF5712 family protein n=1 Tax=Pedobacter sp. PACM 27299 TaxID=1727164 RepID=UPI0007060EA8|nr:DUF5712 family protein [Pedobacter sp. PACM 27299]ALL07019.1 molybdopterin-guanine dinucleotide biosynthesis protein MobB [Pedobacter sp. PACM 27299]
MFINITDSDKGNNKGSCGELVHYLDKENRMSKDLKPELWFNGTSDAIPSYLVKHNLDQNIAKLCKDDAKFFLINISPSQKEISYLQSLYGEKGVENALKEYAAEVMNEYACNFKRPGVNGEKDLLWYAKLEHYRYYGYNDPQVKDGTVKKGSIKPGQQLHVQVIVSRKDITNLIRLSPMNTSKGKNVAHSLKLGQFDRSAFKASGERLFDQQFGFDRGLKETFEYANIQKNGTLQQRLEIVQGKERIPEQANTSDKSKKPTLELKLELPSYLQPVRSTNFLEIALAKSHDDPSMSIKRKKRRKKRNDQQQELGL